MGRHRDAAGGSRPMPRPPGRQVRSHRRPPGVARARAVSLVALGALAGGVAVAGTTAPWSREGTDLRPEARPGGPAVSPGPQPGVLPAPRTAVEPVRSAPPSVPAPVVWRAADSGAFLRTPWNSVGAVPPQLGDDEVVVRLTGRGQRSELEPALPVVREGDRHDLTFSVRLDGEFAPGSAARQVVARWENDGPGRAPLDLRVEDGELVLHGGEGHPSGPRTFTRSLGRAPVGEWTRLRVLVHFSADPDKGGVSVWRDGRALVDGDRPRAGTLYPGQQSYLKIGLHRSPTVGGPSEARFTEWRVEHGRAAADPDEDPAEGRHAARRTVGDDGRAPTRATTSAAGTSHRVPAAAPSRDGPDDEDRRAARSSERDASPDDRPDASEESSGRHRDDTADTPGRHRDAADDPRTAREAADRSTDSGDGDSKRDSDSDSDSARSSGEPDAGS